KSAVDAVMEEQRHGKAGDRILIEEFLVGEEASVHAITDGQTILILEPVQDYPDSKWLSLTFGNVDDVDEFLTLNDVPRENWREYIEYCDKMFKYVCGEEIKQFEVEGFLSDCNMVVMLDSSFGETTNGIIELYDQIREKEKIPRLLKHYASVEGPPLKEILPENESLRLSSKHVGQMGYEFPISGSQRQALFHYLQISDGDIIAVNGPPGTGKTTLLQSLVANSVVEGALKGESPFVIVVSSTNNQAIKNIIESFSKAKTREGNLAGRWVPGINSFALFLPAFSREIKDDTQYVKYNGEGLPDTIETGEYLEKAKEIFLGNCSRYGDRQFGKVKEAVDFLHQRLKLTVEEIKSCFDLWTRLEETTQEISVYENVGGAREYIEKLKSDAALHKGVLDKLLELKNQWLTETRSESFIIRFLIILGVKSLKRKRETRYRMILANCPKPVDHLDYGSPEKIELFIAESIQKQKQLLEDVKKEMDIVRLKLDKWEIARNAWESWKEKNHIQCNPPQTIEALDTGLRHDAFQLAIHYWEGRWLLETEKFLAGDTKRKKSKKVMETKWRRYAMLTPCFVSTFYMLPKFFKYSIYNRDENDYKSLPMLDFIDLLMVDEAGQVAAEIGGASFVLAKKAIAVGDLNQISPVRNTMYKVDVGNMKRFKLIRDWGDKEMIDQLHNNGMSAFKGSVMKIAQEKSMYQLPGHSGRGMFLAEHRRCFDDIIAYCNRLAYGGKLIPLRGSPDPDKLIFPQLGYANINSQSEKSNSSRKNSTEAQSIADWLKENQDKIEERYGDIEDAVGIITPFNAQIWELQKALNKAKIKHKSMKIGTIHTLQGAERPIIIFSPVYGFDEGRGLSFINRQINMLNVAVSRAMDSFLVFGNMCVFDPDQRTPSGILAQFLFRDEANELSGILPRKRKGDVERIDDIERHCFVLKRSIQKAESSVLIVSPYISINAIEHDKLEPEFKDAVSRGVNIKIYTDKHLDMNGKQKPYSAKGREKLKECGVELIVAQGIHNKTLCVDDVYLVEGSFNWLSSPRDPSSKYFRHNASLGYTGEHAAEYIRRAYNEIEVIAKKRNANKG
ncbi:MAG: hypothetical protein GY940_11595, partial [bacterium]|nr:hypothetical protein [bacterium]